MLVRLSGNKRWHSTETSLISTTDFILCGIDDKKITAVVYLDMSKAFDAINHVTFLKKWKTLVYQLWHCNGTKAIPHRDTKQSVSTLLV